jgi:hypothetical protein
LIALYQTELPYEESPAWQSAQRQESQNMLDVIFICVTALFFAASILYVSGCELLRRGSS